MTGLGRRTAVACLTLAGLISGSCDHVTGPTLLAFIESETLVPTSLAANATSLCCCRVQGVVRNSSPISVHVSLRWKAFNLDGERVGLATDFVENIQPDGRASFDAAGIFEACSRVGRLEVDMQVVGLFDAHR